MVLRVRLRSTDGSRGSVSLLWVEARARCAAASPSARRSFELSGGRFNPVPEPMPASPALIAGLSSSASAGPIGCTSGRCALERVGLAGSFFGLSGVLAIGMEYGLAAARTEGLNAAEHRRV